MGTKKDQHTVGTPKKPRGQQTGYAGNPDKNREAMKSTPALGGRGKTSNKMTADKSARHLGGDAASPSATSPSIAGAMPTGKRLGESGGERVAKLKTRKRKRKVVKN